VTVSTDVGTGSLNIIFIDNDTLLYRIDAEMSNRSYQQYGEPRITFSSNTLSVRHEVAAFNITLGTGVNYTIDAVTDTGSINCVISDGAMVDDVTLTTGTGSITFTATDDITLINNPHFGFLTNTGSVTVIVLLPTDVEGDFTADAGFGSVQVTAPTWERLSSSHYRTEDYSTATQYLDIDVETGTGSIIATLS
jgi:hypothetical protein